MQAIGLAMMAAAASFGWWAVAAVLLGAGTAMVYPTLLAAIGAVAVAHRRVRHRGRGAHVRDAAKTPAPVAPVAVGGAR